MLQTFLISIDRFSMAVGHAFAWCILILTLGTSYEVFMRYVLNDPTSWAFDMSYILYGALFIMSGAYALSRNAHVRGDVLFRLLRPRVQATIELVLYFIFFYPGRHRADHRRLRLRARLVRLPRGERQQPGRRADLAAQGADSRWPA